MYKMKHCKGCGQDLLLSNFHNRLNVVGGQYRCKACHLKAKKLDWPKRQEWSKKYLAKNREKLIEYKQQWRKERRVKVIEK